MKIIKRDNYIHIYAENKVLEVINLILSQYYKTDVFFIDGDDGDNHILLLDIAHGSKYCSLFSVVEYEGEPISFKNFLLMVKKGSYLL